MEKVPPVLLVNAIRSPRGDQTGVAYRPVPKLIRFTPLPSLPLLAAGSGLGGIAWAMRLIGRQTKTATEAEARAAAASERAEPPPVEDLLNVDTLWEALA